MAIGFDENTSTDGGGFFLTPENAIDKGRYLKEISIVRDNPNGNPYFDIIIVDKEGNEVNRRFWEPAIDGNIIKDKEGLDKATTKISKILANLVWVYKPGFKPTKEDCVSMISLAEAVARVITTTPGWQQKELWVKFILNSKDYATLPSYSPIFEDGSKPREQVTLKIRPEFNDRVVRDNAKPDYDESASQNISISEDNPF